MKLSEAKKYKKLISALKGTEISNEEVQKTLIAEGIILSNFYQELEMNSNTVDCQEDINYTKDKVQLHSHTFYEVLYCRSGNVQYLLGPDRYRVRRGDIIFVPPGISHRPLYLDRLVEPYARYVMWIHPDFIKSLTENFGFQPLSVPVLLRTKDSGWEYLETYFQSACMESATKQDGYQGCIFSNAIQLLIHLTRACTHSKVLEPLTEKRELLDELIAYIENYLSEKITLKSTAANFYISERSVSRLFSEKMDVSFYRYVTQRRLIAAKVLILNGEPLESIGEQVGFVDYSTFYRAFKQAFSISPLQFKKLHESQRLPSHP